MEAAETLLRWAFPAKRPRSRRRAGRTLLSDLASATPVQLANVAVCVAFSVLASPWLALALQPLALAALNRGGDWAESWIVPALVVGAAVRCFAAVLRVAIQAALLFSATLALQRLAALYAARTASRSPPPQDGLMRWIESHQRPASGVADRGKPLAGAVGAAQPDAHVQDA